MTLTTRIALSLATFGFIGLLGASQAQAGQHNGERRTDNKMHKADKSERLCAKLACSDAQKTQIKAIKDAKAPQMKAARDNLRKLHAQLKVELHKPSPDVKVIERLDAEMAAQKAAVHKQRRASQLQVLALLKPDQKAKFLDRSERGGNKGHGKGHGKGKGKLQGPQRAG
nr:Spy/CpxP family protein refolding chaperone [Nannocystis sp.]